MSTKEIPSDSEPRPYEALLNHVVNECNYELTKEKLPEIIELAAGNPYSLMDIYTSMILEFGRMGFLDTSEQLLQSALTLIGDGSKEFEVKKMLVQAEYYDARDEHEKVLEIIEKATALSIPNSELQFRAMSKYVRALTGLGQYDKALSIAFKIIELTYFFPIIRSSLLRQMGFCYEYLGKLPEAEQAMISCLDISRKLGKKRNIAGDLSNLADLSSRKGNWFEARKIGEEALVLISQTSAEHFRTIMLNNLCIYCRKGGDLDASLGYGKMALELSQKIGNKKLEALSNYRIGWTYLKLSRFEESLVCLKESLLDIDVLREDYFYMHVYHGMALCFESLGRFEDAYRYLEKYRVAEEERMQARLNGSLILNEHLQKQAFQNEREAQELKQQQIERELTNSTLQLIAQTELLSELRDGLLQVVRKFPMPDGAAKELRERLKTLPCKAVDWEKFEAQFKAAHPEFKRKLIEKYPEISPAEVRMCELLRMNLKNHEIARLTCLSERTVEDHRYQIRKKIGVKTGENVVDYLVKI
jgi:tetratricopeptide (TPR) repeat protein